MDIPTFSLPAEVTCPNATDLCKKYCYAKKAERMYPKVLPSRKRNYRATKDRHFVQVMWHDLSDLKSEYIRIHESGDFYSQEYLNKWFKICKLLYYKKFLVYTQMYDLDWSNKPDNLIVYWTVWPDTNLSKVPEGLRAYVIDSGSNKIPKYKTEPKCKICTKGKGNKLICNDCMWCYEGKGDIKFKIH